MRITGMKCGQTVAAAGALLAAMLAMSMSPLAAQTDKTEWVIRQVHNDQRFEIAVRGRIELSDDERSIVRLSPGGRFQIEEVVPGAPSRLIIVTPDSDGTLRYVYLVNGVQQPWDDTARAWLAQQLPRAAREYGMGAEARVRRIHAANGASGVLDEVERIESGSSRRAHLKALFALGPMPARELPRALRLVSEVSGSSAKAELLRAVSDQLDLREERHRTPFFEMIRGIASSSQRGAVLKEVIARPDASADPVLLQILDVAGTISSSSEKAAVLIAFADRQSLERERVRDAFFSALDGISSSSERRRVLLNVLQRHEERPAVTRSVIRSAAAISSDSEKATVLLAVPAAQLNDTGIAQLYRQSMETIRSSSQRERVARRLYGAQG